MTEITIQPAIIHQIEIQPAPVHNIVIERIGVQGPPNSLTIGTVTEGVTPSASITGTAPDQVLNLVLAAGEDGTPGAAATLAVGAVSTLPPGSPATVVNVGTPNAAVLDIGLPAGNDGDDGASTWGDISGKPTVFPPEAHAHAITDITDLQAALDAKTTPGFVTAAIDALKAGVSSSFDTLSEIVAGFIPNSLLTTRGDIIRRGAGAAERLALGASGYALKSNGTDAVWALSREALTANRTYYVRTDGSDSNNGLANTSGGAFLTLQKAYDTITANLDLGGYAVTVQVGAGTYATGVAITQPWSGGGAVTFLGDSSTPGNVIISATAARCFYWNCNLPGALTVNGFKVQTTTSGDAIRGDGAGTCTLNNMEYGVCAGRQLLLATPGANFLFGGTYLISGGAASHWVVENLSRLRCDGKTITITGTPAFSTAFASAALGGVMQVNGNTFSGSATGRRYQITTAGGISTAGGGATYLPGNSSPSDILTTPGWYV